MREIVVSVLCDWCGLDLQYADTDTTLLREGYFLHKEDCAEALTESMRTKYEDWHSTDKD